MTSALVWFRRDLRLDDNAALSRALACHRRVFCAFIFDTEILAPLPRRDRRVEFILASLSELDAALRARGGGLIVRHGCARDEIPRLAAELGVAAVFANRDYEPAAIDRDRRVAACLAADGRAFRDFKDQVIFERDEILTGAGRPFSVFTPYSRAWLKMLDAGSVASHRTGAVPGGLAIPAGTGPLPTLADLGFRPAGEVPSAGATAGADRFRAFLDRIDSYAEHRDFPAVDGCSGLSVHLRFGTLSIRQLVGTAWAHGGRGAETWIKELIWREFYQMILWAHPRVERQCFKPAFDALAWDRDAALWDAWRDGRTGYPLVDAAMRHLKETGNMHNRLRMVTASFLAKDLGLDWRRGEAWFAQTLNDFDLPANNGGWQWAASTGCDAQPWFRIFNPVTQSEKFDAEGRFIRRQVPELAGVPARHIHAPWRMSSGEQEACGVVIGRDYPRPVVDHARARARTLERYGRIRTAS